MAVYATSTTAARVTGVGGGPFLIKNMDGAIIIYLGDSSSVTTANGFPLGAGETLALDAWRGDLWAVAASGTPALRSFP